VKFSKGETDEAAKWYSEGRGPDPTWGKPVFKLAPRSAQQGRQRLDHQDARESHQRRPDVPGSRAGEDRHRTVEEIVNNTSWLMADGDGDGRWCLTM
jgi:hypothetical protein